MNKCHWVSIHNHHLINRELIEDLIQRSYELIASTCKKVDRQQIDILKNL